jgi:hypothetical protein
MKVYAKENTLVALVKADAKTFQKWVWQYIQAIAILESELVSMCSFG